MLVALHAAPRLPCDGLASVGSWSPYDTHLVVRVLARQSGLQLDGVILCFLPTQHEGHGDTPDGRSGGRPPAQHNPALTMMTWGTAPSPVPPESLIAIGHIGSAPPPTQTAPLPLESAPPPKIAEPLSGSKH
jgi:hypothetical protein